LAGKTFPNMLVILGLPQTNFDFNLYIVNNERDSKGLNLGLDLFC